MLREECRVGLPVIFGRPNGEKTKGIIRKINPTTAKVETTEDRSNRTVAGQMWKVQYALIQPDPNASAAVSSGRDPADEPLVYHQFDENNPLLEIILKCYGDLSPENLTCDGELPMTAIRQKKARLDRWLKHLQLALGRQVSETVIYNWYDQKGRK